MLSSNSLLKSTDPSRYVQNSSYFKLKTLQAELPYQEEKLSYGLNNGYANSEYNTHQLYFNTMGPAAKSVYNYGNNPIYNPTNGFNRCNKEQCYGMLKDYAQFSPVAKAFFSKENIKVLQQALKDAIKIMSHGKINLLEDQNESDLLIAMRATYLNEGMNQLDNIPFQVKQLNKRLINSIVPEMITAILGQYNYLKEINEPRRLVPLPINTSVKGRNTLPSVTTTWA